MRVERVFEQKLGRPVPRDLDAMLQVLAVFGASPAAPDPDLHPLVVPVARHGAEHIGLLIWPTPAAAADVPVVALEGPFLRLRAATPRDWVRDEVGQVDHAGAASAELLAAAEGCYRAGEAQGGNLDAWRLTRAGGSPAVHDRLVARHLERGDALAALITRERCGDLHPGWAEPQALRAWQLLSMGHAEEARDAARVAVALPRWTMTGDVAAIGALAQESTKVDPRFLRARAEDAAKPPLDRAAWRMDAASVAGEAWSAVRGPLAAMYKEAGLLELAGFVAS